MGKIAVVGIGGVFPRALNIGQFLDNILHKRDSVITVPDHRWVGPVNEFLSKDPLPDTAVSNKAGLIENFYFDPDGFLVDKDLLSRLDPLHHLVLQAGRDAFLQCSHTPDEKKRTGVILAAIALPTDTSSAISRQLIFDKNGKWPSPLDFSRAAAVSFPAALLSRAMGFGGGSFTLDAACASSLYAIKLACEHLDRKKADIMVAGGVSRPDSLYTQIGFTQLQALSPSGRCSPFDRAADGLVVGEGTGIVVLKRLEDAVSCKDKILAVITGAGVSNDIDGTLVGPASEGQLRAMTQAFDQASWSPKDIQYMECHGSGTPVGDQVELSSIHALLASYGCPDTHLSLGSVKSMTGHLLTAAGAAGFIKTILSMNQGFLPPSLNYSAPPAKSILNTSNIRVQTQVEDWIPGTSNGTRKAGVSAFGFGGINAHLLVEEFRTSSPPHFLKAGDEKKTSPQVPCAIIGMETLAKDCLSLSRFESLVFGNKSVTPQGPGARWRRRFAGAAGEEPPGFYMEAVSTRLGEFHIPPNQLEDILPQHILLLKAAKGALEDANINPRPTPDNPLRHRMGCAIGIEFDYGATDFHLRWAVRHLHETLKDSISPPLTFNRTLGALGGIVASRVAREFKLGGPCFTLSANAASGIKAIETAVLSLGAGETDLFICGCVDLAGDLRQFALNDAAKPHTHAILPSEGAAAIVLKRLDQAMADKDRIYGVITGVGGAGGGMVPGETGSDPERLDALYARSLETALESSQTRFKEIGLYETCASGIAEDDATETRVLKTLSSKDPGPFACHVSSASAVIGNTRAASSLFSVIKAALCLNYRMLPAHPSMAPEENIRQKGDGIPRPPVPWPTPDRNGPRKACAASITLDGACAHVILEEHRQDIDIPRTWAAPAPVPSKNDLVLKTNPRPISDKTLLSIQDALGPAPQTVIDPDPAPVRENLPIKAKPVSMLDPELIARGTDATSLAHEKFLQFSKETMQHLEEQFATLTRLAGEVVQHSGELPVMPGNDSAPDEKPEPEEARDTPPAPFLDRDQCLEYATGKAGHVLGKDFDIIDTYPVRVRLPADPLMLVDRIMEIQGEKLSLTSGKIITQHDVKENAWYLDGGKAPVSISIEAGQADLFLCAWLGIDHAVKGKRKYRLLDARVTFHRSLPSPGETIEYHIEIDRFLKQGEVYLFFFHYEGYINKELLISMRDGCAGFFTEEEVENSGGIILKKEDRKKMQPASVFAPLVPVKKESFSDEKISALRDGHPEIAFGRAFTGIRPGRNLNLPGGRMHLVDRVLELDPHGGRFGMGAIVAEADIHPDDWFLTCHFIDDRVMPGTLMYECCAHALRIFTQRMGWISDREDVFYDVLPGNESDLKCRGPVTPETKKARYEIEIKEMGYAPEPYVIADAHMFSDDLRIVLYKNMGMKLVGLTRGELDAFWREQ